MKLIGPASAAEFEQYYDLRWKILRAPWNQPRGSEQDTLDATSIHVMVIADNKVALGVGRLHFNTISEAQIRFMAVDVGHQRRGIGTLILKALETRGAELGATRIVLDARETALGFYCKLGYSTTGPGPMLYDRIAHVKMSKLL
ncbi:MAG: GNAT family N-acetyltransferase [Gammaproteobacteria bacterium]|nr:GNAT family N-acetyltransferase [Gammaproteobacteria bacterium]